MTPQLRTLIFPVEDLAAAKALYSALLGTEPTVDQPYYVHFALGELEIGLDPSGHGKGMTGPVTYWQVDDIAVALDGLVAAGAEVREAVTDVGGRLVATVVDADGNPSGLMQTASA
jgi:predicted enzyme related to lactoylglutathione lyase